MRICLFQSSYEESDDPLAGIDTELSDPSPYTTQHTFEHRLIHKDNANKEIDAAAAEGFDFYISFMWGSHDDLVAGIDACRYLESLDLPMLGLRSQILNRSKQEFYDEARRLGAPRVPGTKLFLSLSSQQSFTPACSSTKSPSATINRSLKKPCRP